MVRYLSLLLLAACSASADPAPARVVVSPEVAEDAIAALDLWTAATDGAFAPEVTVSDDCAGADWCITAVDPATALAQCNEPVAPRACNWRTAGVNYITLNRDERYTADRVESLAHETGHRLGLVHLPGTGDLMDPHPPQTMRLAPCVSARDVADAGFTGPGTCE